MKLADYVAAFLVKQGIKHVFVITGGASAHLIDSIARTRGIDYICPQHEQAGAMAADAYARVTGNLGAAIATSGPGATNMILSRCYTLPARFLLLVLRKIQGYDRWDFRKRMLPPYLNLLLNIP